MKTTPRRSSAAFTLFELLLGMAIMAGLALMLTVGLFLAVRSQGFTVATNENTNRAGQVLNRILHGVGTHRPLREAVKNTASVLPEAGGGWTLVYKVRQNPNNLSETPSEKWLRYNPRTRTLFNQAGRVFGEDIVAAGASANQIIDFQGQTVVDSVDIWLSVQSASNGRALTETLSTRVQFRNHSSATAATE